MPVDVAVDAGVGGKVAEPESPDVSSVGIGTADSLASRDRCA
jgi:hypothetical protein